MIKHQKIVNTGFYLLLCLILHSAHATGTEKVRLQLKWQHQFQFAGYYTAIEKGYYSDVGLDVELLQAQPNIDPTKTVLEGNAEYGIGNNSLLLLRNAGEPVVILGVIFQHSPYIILSQRHSDTQNIHDLANKRLMLEPLSDELFAYLKHEGIAPEKLQLIKYQHNINAFINGKVDAISAYVTDEPFLLEQKGIPYYAYSPRAAGIDFYGDNLFTTEHELITHPERVRKFLAASLKGWTYAMQHPEEITDLILRNYSTRKSREALLFEAKKMQQLMHPEIIKIGYMLPGRWKHIAEIYAELGMLPENISLDGFLFDPDPKKDYFWLYITLITITVIALLALMLNIYFSKLAKKFKHLLHLKSRFSNIGEAVNNISHQWKQPLNELGIQLMLIETTTEKSSCTLTEKIEIKKRTDKSHEILEFMARTVDTFGNLLHAGITTENIYPGKVIDDILLLIHDSFAIHQIAITTKIDYDLCIIGDATKLSHSLLSILNNSRDIFLKRETKNPTIRIQLYNDDKFIYIDIEDNGGGIHVTPVDKIFKLGFSTNTDMNTGVGLHITQQLIKEEFNGSIQVKNINQGVCFTLSLALHRTL